MTYPLTKSLPENQRERWESFPLNSLIGGINTQERPDKLRPDQVMEALNLITYKMELRRDTGYIALGTGTALDSMIKRQVEYNRADGGIDLLGITKGSVYIYNTTVLEWQYVKGTASTDLDGAFVTGNTALKVDSSAGFLAGEKIGIMLTNGKQYRTTIDSVPDGTHITIVAPGLPSGASDEGIVVRAVVLAGSDLYPCIAVNVPSNNWLAFTNNVDYVKRWNGTDCVDVSGLVQTTCAAVVLFNSALFLLNTKESGTRYMTRVRRSEIGDPTTWSGGTAGYDDMLDTAGAVVGGDVLGPYLIVYKGRTVYRAYFANTGGKYYQFDAMLHGESGEGLVATDGLVNMGTYHVIFGNANIFKYVGDFVLTPMGDEIFYLTFASGADVNADKIPLAFGVYVENLKDILFFYASSASSWPNVVVRYNLNTGAWTKRKFANGFNSAAIYHTVNDFKWSDIVGLWSDQTWTWNSISVAGAKRPTILLSSTDSNVAYIYDFLSALDLATTITGVMETRDFIWSGGKFRTDRMDMYVQGLNILVQYSQDAGVSWNTWDTVSSSNMGRVQSYRQVVGDSLRFRFTCSDPNFRMRWLNLTWRPESVQ